MAFPYADRDYSLYSTSTNEGSVGRAQHDLDRCAQILNEVLDNGAGILDGVKKRKSASSPSKESSALLHHKKVRQTNKYIPTEEEGRNLKKISSSTPQHASLLRPTRQRSASTSSICSYNLRSSGQRRHRSLSQQRNVPARSSRSREYRSSSEHRSYSAAPSRILDSVNSMIANGSAVSSEADTLTGVHLDSSSQFGVPPVFNARGERRRHQHQARTKSRQTNLTTRQTKTNMGWLKPQASISTQTLAENKENISVPKVSAKGKARKLGSKASSDTDFKLGSKRSNAVKLPSAAPIAVEDSRRLELSSPTSLRYSTRGSVQRENDVDDLLERTLIEKESSLVDQQQKTIPNQIEIEERITSHRSNTVVNMETRIADLVQRLKNASQIEDRTELSRELEQVSVNMHSILRGAGQHHTSVDQLLIPFQRESKELKEQVKHLRQQLAKIRSDQQRTAAAATQLCDNGDDSLSRDLSLQVVTAETRNSQLSNQLADMIVELNGEKRRVSQLTADLSHYTDQVDDLKRENRQLHMDLSSKLSKQILEPAECRVAPDSSSISRKLLALQQSVRLFHTRLTHIAAQCESRTAKQIHPVLELCAHHLIESMSDSQPLPATQVNANNNGRWGNKPGNLAEVVSANLLRARTDKESTSRLPSQPASKDDYRALDALESSYQPFTATDTLQRSEAADPFPEGGNIQGASGKLDNLVSDSRYSMTKYFQKYYPKCWQSPVEQKRLLSHSDNDEYISSAQAWQPDTSIAKPDDIFTKTNVDFNQNQFKLSDAKSMPSSDYKRYLFPTVAESPLLATAGAETGGFSPDQLQSTLVSNDSTLIDPDLQCSESVSTLSMATTMADNAFQEGLAKLDANIAKLQDSLKTSRLGSTL